MSRLRKNLGYSQAEFAEILGVSTQAVSKWETGLTLPDIEVLLNISWICKTSINNILESDDFIEYDADIDRSLLRLNKFLICPECKKMLKLNTQNLKTLFFECENKHRYYVIDGVVDFKTREISGEQWSLSYRNYDEYLHEHHCHGNPNNKRGLDRDDAIWKEIEKLRPRLMLDMACGTGQGIKQQIKRINWPTTVIMVDISHRILKWNKAYYSTEWKNPYVEMVYLACDGANLPILSDSVDVVFSYAGYESMQTKMLDGFREAFRVLKNGGHTIYTKSAVEDHESENSVSVK
ncbi:methyltransferase domain-containing protein [Clostridium thermosuccinogenes]|uniref:methyltransferase domain-containing protein n=1 Tax=Clostridium thermosuccinogenes TaxID=84032 RepID=UPI00237B561B|nr:methyltransferase domain-containing protein [Pseudoclostridium thermosuccinogenes]